MGTMIYMYVNSIPGIMSVEQIEWSEEGRKAITHRENQGRLWRGCYLRWAIKHGYIF